MKRKAKRVSTAKLGSDVKKHMFNGTVEDGLGTKMPPSYSTLQIYFDQKNMLFALDEFFAEHQERLWKNLTGQQITNWKVCAAEWLYNYKQVAKRKLRKSPFRSEFC